MAKESKEISLARGTAIVSVLTLASRILGFIRDLLVARGFGSSIYADCFFVAFRIPNLLRSLVAEGALSSAFVPVFADAVKQGDMKPAEVFSKILGFLLILSTFLCALSVIYAESIVKAFAPGFTDNPDLLSLCVSLTCIMLPLIICVSLVAMINGALNTLGNFGASAWAQIWMNLALIIGAVIAMYFDSYQGVRILAWSALTGSILQVLVQLPALAKKTLRLKPDFRIFNAEIALLLKLMLPAILGATVYQLGIFLNTLLASLLQEGSVSWLYYADRIIQFPLGTFSIALGSVLLPALALSFSHGKKENFSEKTFAALGYTSFLMLPLSVFVYAFAEELVELLYQRGSFNSNDTLMTALAVKTYSAGLWAVSSYGILARTFIARKDTLTATLVGILSLLINLFISLMAIGNLPDQAGILKDIQFKITAVVPALNLGHAGLSMASAIASNCSFLILCLLSVKHLDCRWSKYIYTSWLSLLISVTTGWLCINLKSALNLSSLSAICFGLAAGSFTYMCACYLFKINEAKQIAQLVIRKIRPQS